MLRAASTRYHMVSSIRALSLFNIRVCSAVLITGKHSKFLYNIQSSCLGLSTLDDHMEYSNPQIPQRVILTLVHLLSYTCNALTNIQLYSRQARVFFDY
jgi:hypothetical protein